MASRGRLQDQFAALERAMRDWELVDSDRFSFDDSDHFEEDSLCSWISEPESLCNNWRGWKKSSFATPNNTASNAPISSSVGTSGTSLGVAAQNKDGGIISNLAGRKCMDQAQLPPHLNLVELSAKVVASHIPFEMVERIYPPVPEQLQLRIAFWSFPEHEEDIRLYSCLANGSAEEFQKGERLFRSDSVADILQIGFHLSATVKPNMREAHKVAVTFDRRRVTSCTCTCNASTNWCGHVVAVCLGRIFQSKDVMLRAPVSESLSRLHRDQLQKFAQYLISELPQQILPTAQRLLDELLSSQKSAINTLRGAPDPTAGASANEQTSWFLDEKTLHGNIHKILIKFCVPAPIVFSDVNYLSSAAPPASAEWSSLLRPLRGREPEGMWNLLSIVREMFRREDRNAIPLLEIITEECLNCDQILVWWFNTKVALHNGNAGHGTKHHSVNSNAHACQHAGSSLCDEIVLLWRLAALNPGLSPDERCILHSQFKEWHLKIIDKVSKSRNASIGSKHGSNSFKNDIEIFPGFRPSIEACYLTWDEYPIPGVTYSDSNHLYQTPFMCFRHSDGHSRSGETGMIHSSHAVLNNPAGEHHLLHSSATISSIPRPSSTKRPRSVDFTSDKNVGGKKASGQQDAETKVEILQNDAVASTSSASTSALPSTSRASAKALGKDTKKDDPSEGDIQGVLSASGGPADYPPMPLSASGLKVKEGSCLSSDRSQSFDEDVNPSCSTSNYKRRTSSGDFIRQDTRNREAALVAVGKCPVATDGTRSSVSSEGFCEPDLEGDLESLDLSDESAIQCSEQMNKVNIPAPGEKSSTIDYPEADVEDSDSSFSVPNGASSKVASKLESSDSQQSGDEYQQLYYYDTKAATNSVKRAGGKVEGNADSANRKESLGFGHTVSSVKLAEDPWEILFARAEGLHAHGHSQEACILGVKLAGELLANPPNLSLESLPAAPVGKGKKRKVNPATHQVSCLASATLAKSGFLCTVLAENADYYYLAFQVGMFGLELCRPPASTKPLEVKLANQEAELALLLKRICIGSKELEMIRSKAASLRDGKFKSRGDALLPLVLANFIFDALVMPLNREGRCALQQGVFHISTDEQLGFEAAVAALGLKANISEADHPLLCEGTRRQRGDLALTMLLHYKDDADKLARIMDKLLDREIHQLCKTSLPAAYYSNNPPTTPLLGATSQGVNRSEEKESIAVTGAFISTNLQSALDAAPVGHVNEPQAKMDPITESHQPLDVQQSGIATSTDIGPIKTVQTQGLEGTSTNLSVPVANGNVAAQPSTSCQESNEVSTLAASISSAGPPGVPGASNVVAVSGGNSNGTAQANSSITTTATKPGREPARYKGKRNYPVLPNQPSEAGAHFMFELAKVVLGKAGGSSNQSLFTQPSTNQNPRGPHRALHMCAFHMGLYALGLHNAVSPNWLSRTYSSNVSWITGQAMEIGAPAIAFLIDTWDAHLTPPEAVTIADRASRGDQNMVRAAAELALSCLPYAQALNPNEIHRAILQCKEQSDGMLEKACLTVENAAKGGGVYPEVLFDVARQWYSLYQKHLPLDVDVMNEDMNHHESLLSGLDPGMEPLPGQMHGPNVHMINQGSLQPSAMGASLNPQSMNLMPSNSNSLEVIGLATAPPVVPHSAVYPMPSPQVPLTSIPPYGSASYGHVPFLPPGYSPIPGNYMYGQALLYQATGNPNNGPGVVTTTATFYNQQTQPHNGYNNMPPMHQQPIHNMVPGGPSLQYYPPVPMNGTPHGHLRPGSGFYPVMTLHGNHGGPMQSSNSPVTASMAAHPSAHTHTVSTLTSQTHVVAIPTSGGPSVNSQQQQLLMTAAANIAQGHNNQGAAMAHNMGMSGHALRSMPGPSQMNYQPQLNPHQQGASGYHSNVGSSKAKPGMLAVNGALLQNAGDVPMNNQPNGRPTYYQRDMAHSPANAAPSSGSGQASALKMKYLLAAYRVGMLAMETLARRVHDDRPAAKFARNPPYGEDVKWLLGISRKLGPQYLQQFCVCAVSSIANPFVLHEIILDASHQGRSNNLTWVYQNPRSPLYPLVQKCQQMYFQCLHQKLYHITISDYEDFVNIVCTARQAFNLTPDGISQFKEWLQNLRKSKAYKKELWSQITTALQANQK